jgi:ATP phosphoribosyltransferase
MSAPIKLVLPKGRIQEKVIALLERAGLKFRFNERSYRPVCNASDVVVKVLKPQNIPQLIALGRHDAGFSGLDWVLESKSDVTEVLDLGFDPVKIVAAVPDELAKNDAWRKQKLIVASEYPVLSQKFIDEQQLDAVLVRSYGATEALPPEDADLIVDNTATGSTLRMNHLTIVATLLESTTRFLANHQAMADPSKGRRLEELATLMCSTLLAEQKVLLEMNVAPDRIDALLAVLPAMRAPTVSPLYQQQGFAVKAAVAKKDVPNLIPQLVAAGAQDILEYRLEKIVP